jgi:endoglucanase
VRPTLVLVALAFIVSAPACASSKASPASGPGASGNPAARAADRFLSGYVTGDGRVIRHDQGGDIVSEGQAYGMLVAELAGRPALARTIWSWTDRHLGRPDGLFAWQATGAGQIEDPQSATDADTLIAYALLRSQGAGAAGMHRAGRRIARAVLAHEAVSLPDGTRLPVAGPWATAMAAPATNPSYLMPGVFRALARRTGDRRWAQAAAASVRLVRGLTDDGRQLPPDWAVVTGGRLAAAPQPGGGVGVQYGLDAARVPSWFAAGCDADARRLAAAWWPKLRTASAGSPVQILAAAAAATAAGDRAAAGSQRTRAEAVAANTPTYYGDAWAALGPALLDGRLVPCGRSEGSTGHLGVRSPGCPSATCSASSSRRSRCSSRRGRSPDPARWGG